MKMNAVLATPFRAVAALFHRSPRPADGNQEIPIITVTGLSPKAAAASQRSPFPIITVTGLSPTAPPQPSPTAKSIASASGTLPDRSADRGKTLEDVILGLCAKLRTLPFGKRHDDMPFRVPAAATPRQALIDLAKRDPDAFLKQIETCNDPVLLAGVLKDLLASSCKWYYDPVCREKISAAFGRFQEKCSDVWGPNALSGSITSIVTTVSLNKASSLGKEEFLPSPELVAEVQSWVQGVQAKSPDAEQPNSPLTPPVSVNGSAVPSGSGSRRSSIASGERPETPDSLVREIWDEAAGNIERAEAPAQQATPTVSPWDIDTRMSQGARYWAAQLFKLDHLPATQV